MYTTVEPEVSRSIESNFQVVAPGSLERRLFPLAFCRECGQEYLMARRELRDGHQTAFRARHTLRPSDRNDGYLYIAGDYEWPVDPIAENRLPDSWLTTHQLGPEGRRCPP